MEKVVVIVGPTASGKTKLSIELAKKMNGEIVSCDSMQVYKYMDTTGEKPVIIPSAPASVKVEARRINKIIEKKFGENDYFIIKD